MLDEVKLFTLLLFLEELFLAIKSRELFCLFLNLLLGLVWLTVKRKKSILSCRKVLTRLRNLSCLFLLLLSLLGLANLNLGLHLLLRLSLLLLGANTTLASFTSALLAAALLPL